MCRDWCSSMLLLTIIVSMQPLLTENKSHFFVNQNSGTFVSPNYPANYPPRSFEMWQITVAADQRISLILDPFFLEISGGAADSYDVFVVFDGVPCSTPVIGLYTGIGNETITSTENQLSAILISDNSFEETGFNATFESIKNDRSVPSTTKTATRVCGGILKKRSGVINKRRSALGNLCIWRISVGANLKITLTVEEATVQRNYGWFRVFDGENCNANVISFELGQSPNLPKNITSTGNNLVIMTYGIRMKAQYNTGSDESSKKIDLEAKILVFRSPQLVHFVVLFAFVFSELDV
ncbi:hypothetical protein P879_09888 [Paragonimus westermani]|uniref:CUB domain-containing protein n=1 Tax=Paragonimus westermani TaxID=34504 RepID=A0A8T0DCE7_9TREM|nr:hypothetical protein P879_09888 [Paragonimus westermani]